MGSFNASNEPLYVLDGVPITSGNMSSNDMNTGGLGFISTLNPADIENITVLKDAASASLYGARGANGVVLITTRKGSQGKTTYSLKASYGISISLTLFGNHGRRRTPGINPGRLSQCSAR
ncbi:MAG: TonB-dependent receptor plug domain-containing protein [Butyricimonas faecihominis]